MCEAARSLRGKTQDEIADFCVGGNLVVTQKAQEGCTNYPSEMELSWEDLEE